MPDNESTESGFIEKCLVNWVHLSAGSSHVRRCPRYVFSAIDTGPDIDDRSSVDGKSIVDIFLKATESGNDEEAVVVKGHVEDVPGDGSCGYHAVSRAALLYGRGTALGEMMPISQGETRRMFVRFLQERRDDIEFETERAVGVRESYLYLWKDRLQSTIQVRSSAQITEAWSAERPDFKSLCESILRGDWLSSCVGAIEQHLVCRALGVLFHCVQATADDNLRQTQAPMLFLWRGRLQAEPKGSVVLRFKGRYDAGHYQIIRAGEMPSAVHEDIDDVPPITSVVTGTQPNPLGSRKRKQPLSDVEMVTSMHGVQQATKTRYRKDYKLVSDAFLKMVYNGKNPLELEQYGVDVLHCIKDLIMQRCGPKPKYEGLKASSTGNVVLASVSMWYKNNGISFTDNQSCAVIGNAVRGPPWKADSVLKFKDWLSKTQIKNRSHPVRQAYMLTHDDVADAMREYVAKQLSAALNLNTCHSFGTNPNVNWEKLQTTLMVTAAFGSGCRGAEMVGIRLCDLRFSMEGTETAVSAVLYGVKAKTGNQSVRRVIFPNWSDTSVINPALAVLTQVALMHGTGPYREDIMNGPLFVNIHRNQVQRGRALSSNAYSLGVKALFSELGITECATEHSPRRGCCGFRYYVLGESPDYIRDVVGHRSLKDTLTYIGFKDASNPYVLQGYGICAARPIR